MLLCLCDELLWVRQHFIRWSGEAEAGGYVSCMGERWAPRREDTRCHGRGRPRCPPPAGVARRGDTRERDRKTAPPGMRRVQMEMATRRGGLGTRGVGARGPRLPPLPSSAVGSRLCATCGCGFATSSQPSPLGCAPVLPWCLPSWALLLWVTDARVRDHASVTKQRGREFPSYAARWS